MVIWWDYNILYIYMCLAGGIPTPLKNMKVSWDYDIPNTWKVIKVMFQTTNQIFIDLPPCIRLNYKNNLIPDVKIAEFQWCHNVRSGSNSSRSTIRRRKFRSQTSDNMDRWKAEQGRGREKRKIRREKIRRERVRRKKMQMREKVGKSRNTAFFQWFVAPDSGGSKSRLAKAAGAEPAGQMRDEKLHAVVARSTFWSQNAQNTPFSDHFWKLRCRKSARRCGAKHILKSKCTKHTSFGPLLEVEMSKKCTPLWREAHFEVKMHKTHHSRTTFGSWDVEKVHAVVARSTFWSQNAQNTPSFGPLLEVEMSKKCTPLWREAHFEVKMHKTHQLRTTFGSWDVEKVHAVVARSTFWSQHVQNTSVSDDFWKLRCRKSACRCGAKHISKSKCTKHHMFAPLLEVRMSKKCTPLWREAHFEVKMYKTLGIDR